MQRYLNLQETSFRLVRLEPYSDDHTKRLIKTAKLYWSDPALALWLSGSGSVSGALLETLVPLDLLVWRDSQVPTPEVLYWRATTDVEVDFVIEIGGRLLPIEVKAAASPGYSDTRSLRAFREEYPELFIGGLVLHGGRETQWMSDRILAVPWWRLFWSPMESESLAASRAFRCGSRVPVGRCRFGLGMPFRWPPIQRPSTSAGPGNCASASKRRADQVRIRPGSGCAAVGRRGVEAQRFLITHNPQPGPVGLPTRFEAGVFGECFGARLYERQ